MELEFNFDPRKAPIFRSVRIGRNPLFGLAGFLKKTSSYFLIIFLVLWVVLEFQTVFLGLSLFFLGLCLLFFQIESFFNSKIKNPKTKSVHNIAGLLSFDAAKAIDAAMKKSKKGVNSSSLAYFIWKENPKLNFVFSRIGLSEGDLKEGLRRFEPPKEDAPFYSEDFKETIMKALRDSLERGSSKIEVSDILISLGEKHPFLRNFFLSNDIEREDLRNIFSWAESMEKKFAESKKFWKWENLVKKGSLAKDWVAGYSPLLDRFSIDWTRKFKKTGFPEVIGHEEEIRSMERILSRKEINNVLLSGEAGTGRKTMIYELARRISYGESLPGVNFKRVVELDLPFLLAQAEDFEETERLLDLIFNEVRSSGNIILVINNIHQFVSGKAEPGKLNISGSLSPYLLSPNFQVIGITDPQGLRGQLELNSLIFPYFEKIEVSEISKSETMVLLEEMAIPLEMKYGKWISYLALKSIISYSEKYFPSAPFPKKAMDLLDEAMVYLTQTKEKILVPEHIAKIVSEKSGVPVGELEEEEKGILLDLESLIHKRIINQEEAVSEISSALRRGRADLSERKKPMGSFLFLGPTGVGKTETAKALSEIYFKSEEKMIRIDMSEFQSISDVPRLIGSFDNDGLLTTKVKESPFSLILLDEIEKAHPDILNVFLQVLDDGHVTDGLGRRIDFKNSIIIATSNAGSGFILDSIKEKAEWSGIKDKLLGDFFKSNIFRPELINRFDAVVLFKPLTRSNLLDIADLLLSNIVKGLDKKGIEFVVTPELKEAVIEIGYNPVFGARELKRVIQDKVENSLASSFLSGEIEKGDIVQIDPASFEVKIISN